MPSPLTALVSMIGTAASGDADRVSAMLQASCRSSLQTDRKSASAAEPGGLETMHGLRPASFSTDRSLERILRSPALVAMSSLVMTITRGSSRLRHSCKCAWERSRSAAVGPSTSCEVGEAPTLPVESSVSSAGTHSNVQCGCLIMPC